MKPIKKIALLAVGDSSWQGGIQYIINIIRAIDQVSEKGAVEVHLFKNERQIFPEFNLQNIQLTTLLVDDILNPFSLVNRVIWFFQRKVKGRINPRYENYLLKSKFDFVFPALLSDCGGRLNSAAWIADFQYHHFPDGHNKETTIQAEKTIGAIARTAKKIVFSSNFCERDADKLFPQTVGKSFVMPFAVYIPPAHLQSTYLQIARDKYQITGAYLMVSNLFAATKNHKTLFEALGILRKQGLKINLVCTGNIINHTDLDFANQILQMITDNGIRDQLYLLGLIPRDHQVALYRMATALVQPSVNEGWSTLVEEAKALGKNILLSDIPVHREQMPHNPYFFESLNSVLLASKIKEVYVTFGDQAFPNRQIEENALHNYRNNLVEFGNTFISIASK